MYVILFLGFSGGQLSDNDDISLIVEGDIMVENLYCVQFLLELSVLLPLQWKLSWDLLSALSEPCLQLSIIALKDMPVLDRLVKCLLKIRPVCWSWHKLHASDGSWSTFMEHVYGEWRL